METFELTRLTDELEKLVINFLADYRTKNLLNESTDRTNAPGLNINSNALSSGKLITDSILKNNVVPVDCNTPAYMFKIGNVSIKNPVTVAPLAGISDNTYRIFSRSFGSALTFTEMITAYGIYYKHKKSLMLADITDYERPCALQIFGSDPDIMAEAVKRVEEKADIVDINMGCPVPKILKAKSGGYLLRDEDKVKRIISKVSSVLKKPLTIKTRIGWDSSSINILNIARIAEGSGASAISIHGRTVRQGFSGKADYEIIKKVKERVSIPVIASGDINSSGKAIEVLNYTGCDGIMIGRAAKGRLWLIMNILMAVSGCGNVNNKLEYAEIDPDMDWKKEFSKLYLKFLIQFKGEDRGVKEFRKHIPWIFKGTGGISKMKGEFFKIEDFKGALNCIENI